MFGSKRKRASRACDRCHRLGRKCVSSASPPLCQTCIDYGEECTYVRPQGKRGAPSKHKAQRPKVDEDLVTAKLLSCGLNQETILQLVNLYRTTVYPIYCYFSWSHFLSDVKAHKYETDPGFYSSVMAVCAIAAARIRDGACEAQSATQSSSHLSALDLEALTVDPEQLRAEALAGILSIPYQRQPGFNDLRAVALLAVLGIQNGDFNQLQEMLGHYLGMSAILDFHLESKWPVDLASWEIQERRALFWSTYTLDVFVAMVWGGVVRHRDCQTFVAYPDHTLDDEVCQTNPLGSGQKSSWTQGWNVVTDFYRVLEQILDVAADERRRSEDHKRPAYLPAPFGRKEFSFDRAWPAVRAMYDSLPAIFKETKPITGDFAVDIYSFQAANLSVTLEAVKMSIACSHEISMAERCQIAGELLDVLANIPLAYMQAISAPFLHQLAGVGSLLGSVVQGPLTISSYIHVRQILLTFGNLLASLELSLNSTSSISEGIFQHVARIDMFMQTTAGLNQSDNVLLHDDVCGPAHSTSEQLSSNLHPLSVSAVQSTFPLPIFTATQQLPDTVQPFLSMADSWTGNLDTSHIQTQTQDMAFDPASAADIHETDQVFTLPDDLLQCWPFDQGQQNVFDSFFSLNYARESAVDLGPILFFREGADGRRASVV